MNSDSIKWLVAGLAGSFLCMLLLGAGAFFLFRFAMENMGNLDGFNSEPSYGPDQWQENEREHNEEHAAILQRREESGLLDRYTVAHLHDDTRNLLFESQSFDEVEARLTDQFASADTPMKRLRYSQHIRHIGELYYNEDPAARWETLSSWVEQHPDSYLPYLVRGRYAINYAWYFRGSTYSNRVTEEGWEGFHKYLEQSREDLERAIEMNPQDPEAPLAMITVASALSMGDDVMEDYYQQTLAIDPLHRPARMTKMNFVQPKWGGTWEQVEAMIEDARTHRDEFPMMVKVIRYGEWYMSDRGEDFEGTWNSDETKWMMYEAFRDQAEMSPDDIYVQADLAYWALKQRRFDECAAAFEVVGDRFPEGCDFEELTDYNRWRAISYAEHAQERNVRGTPRERDLMTQAIALEPEDPVVSGLYLAFLAREKDDALARAFSENLEDPYLDTGAWGDGPDYTTMQAMGKAARSDDWGIQGTDQELPLLEEALSLAPDNAHVRLIYAEHHITADEFDKARVHLEKAREVDPDYLPALHIMGWLSFHQERWDEGIAYANQFLESGPSAYVDRYTDDAKEIIELCEEKNG